VAVRENVPRGDSGDAAARASECVDAIAAALEEIARETPTLIRVGVDVPPPASRVRARSKMDALSAARHRGEAELHSPVGTAEIANFASLSRLSRVVITELGGATCSMNLRRASSAGIKTTTPVAIKFSDASDPALIRHLREGRALRGDCLHGGYRGASR